MGRLIFALAFAASLCGAAEAKHVAPRQHVAALVPNSDFYRKRAPEPYQPIDAGPFNSYSIGSLGGNCQIQGTLIIQTSNGASRCLAVGTNGQVLISHGAGADIGWNTVTGTGTVTQVNTGAGLSGGPITGAGTILIATGGVTNTMLSNPTVQINGGTYTLGATSTNLPNNSVTNAQLANTGFTIKSVPMVLGGGPYSITATAASMTVGTTSVLSGTSGDVLTNNSGVLGNVATTGTGNVVLATGPTLTLGNATGLPLSTGVTGVLGSSNGGAGAINGALSGNGSGTVSQAACANLSNGGPYCSATQGQLPGIASNTAASSGNIGQTITSTVLCSATTGVPSGSTINVTSISLPAGEWLVNGNAGLDPAGAATLSSLIVGISTTSASLPAGGAPGYAALSGSFVSSNIQMLATGAVDILSNGSTTAYLELLAVISGYSAGPCGSIFAVRTH